MYKYVSTDDFGHEKKVQDGLEVVTGFWEPPDMTAEKLGLSAREVYIFNNWAISPTLIYLFIYIFGFILFI